MWVPGHGGIHQQNETADKQAKKGARTKPIGLEPLEPFLLLSLSRFRSKLWNWVGKRKQTEWRVCEKYGTSQLFLQRPTNGYVQFISKLYRKHCRMLVGLLTGHTNRHHMLHRMRRARIPSCRRYVTEKETSAHVLGECRELERIRIQTLGFARMDPGQEKEARLSSVVTCGKGLDSAPYKFKWEG